MVVQAPRIVKLLALLALAAPLAAEQVLVPIGRQGLPQQSLPGLPQPGHSMDEVEAALGPPLRRHAPVGEPPISRWEYQHFVVFFEHSTVLDTVMLHRARAPRPDAPRPPVQNPPQDQQRIPPVPLPRG